MYTNFFDTPPPPYGGGEGGLKEKFYSRLFWDPETKNAAELIIFSLQVDSEGC